VAAGIAKGPTLTPLDEATCRRLMATAAIGRVGLSIDALPVVLPVGFVVDGDRVLFRTGEGLKLRQALEGAVVCFQVDDVDPIRHTGWSVLVTGHARALRDPDDLARVRRLPLRPWAPVDGDHHVAITIELVSGRGLGDVA